MFQTDANLGLISTFAEMILQSDEKSIKLLPALPSAWNNGEIKDFCTRCGVKVSMKFVNGVVTKLVLSSDRETDFIVYVNGKEIKVSLSKNQTKEIM
jgi:alpha-L-fucosidase 2